MVFLCPGFGGTGAKRLSVGAVEAFEACTAHTAAIAGKPAPTKARHDDTLAVYPPICRSRLAGDSGRREHRKAQGPHRRRSWRPAKPALTEARHDDNLVAYTPTFVGAGLLAMGPLRAPLVLSLPLSRQARSYMGGVVFFWFFRHKNKTPIAFAIGVSEFNLDDDLLSHGETPHYHRRCIVSLLSSGWDQVVPMLYGRQEIRVLSRGLCPASANWVGDSSVFCESQTFGLYRLHTPQSGLSTQIAWVLYGQASRAISIG